MGSDDNKKKKITIVSICSLILVAMVVGVAVGVNRNTGASGSSSDVSKTSTSTKAVKTICEPTEYKETCETSLSNNAPANETDPKVLIKVGFSSAIDELKQAMKNSSTLNKASNDPRTRQALENCQNLMDSAIDDLNKSVNQMDNLEITKLDDYLEDLKVWLTGAVTFQENCINEFENASDTEHGEKIKKFLNTSRQLTANGLDMVNHFSSVMSSLDLDSTKRSLLSTEFDQIPSWVSNGRRRILAADAATIQADVTVAQDGSGKYKTINEALKDYPATIPPNKTFVIHIKEGIYKEYVTVPKNMVNVMFIGDGATKTKITGNKNFIDGTNTMNTATVAITGPNFMAKDMRFENSAGAIKHQAVALRVQADDAIFYNCQMDGYQDTLYVHAHRQFYRDCTVTGTIDFIFGDAAAIFQNCIFIVRKPMEGQHCIVTAQGRSKANEMSGIVIQNCTFAVEKDFFPVRDGHNVFLGRPWREFSRTIIMQSYLGDFIHPEGWMPWNGDFGINTCFYAEYGNRGPGSDQSKRVTWRGIKKIDSQQAAGFTIGKFYQDGFIKASGVPYTPGLITV